MNEILLNDFLWWATVTLKLHMAYQVARIAIVILIGALGRD